MIKSSRYETVPRILKDPFDGKTFRGYIVVDTVTKQNQGNVFKEKIKANSFVTKMLDSTNNYPSPKDSASANRLQMTQTMLTESARLLKEVKDKKAKKR
jgi:hypothetical protein